MPADDPSVVAQVHPRHQLGRVRVEDLHEGRLGGDGDVPRVCGGAGGEGSMDSEGQTGVAWVRSAHLLNEERAGQGQDGMHNRTEEGAVHSAGRGRAVSGGGAGTHLR